MSKVVHLPNEAHAKAKAYCEVRKLLMSEWVAGLIDAGVAEQQTTEPKQETESIELPQRADPRPGLVPVMKRKLRNEDAPTPDEDLASFYEAPPFWQQLTDRRR